jgi:hypothetical protein
MNIIKKRPALGYNNEVTKRHWWRWSALRSIAEPQYQDN